MNCCKVVFRVHLHDNTVERKGSGVAAHQSRENWGKEAWDCAEANEDRRA